MFEFTQLKEWFQAANGMFIEIDKGRGNTVAWTLYDSMKIKFIHVKHELKIQRRVQRTKKSSSEKEKEIDDWMSGKSRPHEDFKAAPETEKPAPKTKKAGDTEEPEISEATKIESSRKKARELAKIRAKEKGKLRSRESFKTEALFWEYVKEQ